MNQCATDSNQFLVSVADIMLFDITCDKEMLMLVGKTELNTSITQSIQSTSIYAGKGAQKIFEYNYQKELAIAIEDAVFDAKYIAMQNGTKIVSQLADFYIKEEVTFDTLGKATLKETPAGDVQVLLENGEYKTITPTGKEVLDVLLKDKKTSIVYAQSTVMDTITIDAKTFPKAMKLVMNVDIFTNAGKQMEMQITVPQFKPDGALEISLTTDGVASSALNGSALIDKSGNYAYFAFKDVSGQNSLVAYTALAANPSVIDLAQDVGLPVTPQVIGIRGGAYGNVPLDNSTLTWESSDTNVATVDPTGKISLGATAVAGQKANITVTKDALKDVISVEII